MQGPRRHLRGRRLLVSGLCFDFNCRFLLQVDSSHFDVDFDPPEKMRRAAGDDFDHGLDHTALITREFFEFDLHAVLNRIRDPDREGHETGAPRLKGCAFANNHGVREVNSAGSAVVFPMIDDLVTFEGHDDFVRDERPASLNREYTRNDFAQAIDFVLNLDFNTSLETL